jgi:hypothetical protein
MLLSQETTVMQPEITDLRERVTVLERELRKIKIVLKKETNPTQEPWWEQRAGQFKNDPLFDQIVAAGEAYRRTKASRAQK